MEYKQLEGNDLGVINSSGQFLIYNPVNDLIPRVGMMGEELAKCTQGVKWVTIPYLFIRQVFLDKESKWKNKDYFSNDNSGGYCYGRGDITIEFKDGEDANKAIEDILKKEVGLKLAK